ncbi:hypothetical protein M2454_003086 [Aequitasia blattaphilus]|uniref:HNH endonuclease n=1 Tax=Aequitasia blattaphilus TaxID=2949332 RepID=A0ABT1ED26_9FIRM|nr:HNH endonuclease signature motif containing protein [Aequitasia blattaphilus]MCP1103735.1 HNH endonuclease [Aequitasia blattaphilus]MCR8616375.1 HNH endonuclease [Aequitasia blattaphilus]
MSNGKQHKYTQEEKDYLAEIVPGRSRDEITEMFNAKFGTNINIKALSSAYKRFGLSTGRTGYFVKGQAAHNKGKKMSPATYERCKGTMFKKGNVPKNHKRVGSERVSRDGYYEIKVAEPNKWRAKHLIEWESHNGMIPKGKVIIFLDGDPTNYEIDNLAMIDRATHVRLNQSNLRSTDKELTKTGVAVAQLITTMGKAKRRK